MADVTFETEFQDSVSKAAQAAARATALLSKEIRDLSKADMRAAREAQRLSEAWTRNTRSLIARQRVARQADRLMATTTKRQRVHGKSLLAEVGTLRHLAVAAGGAVVAYGAIRVAAVAAQKAFDFTNSIFQMAKLNEKTRLTFKLLAGGEAGGKAAFQASRDLAVELGQDVEVVSTRMARLLAQQFSLEESKGLVRMIADLQAINIEGEKADRVLMALTQIRSKGRLQAEEMLQLAEAGIPLEKVYSALGRTLGKSRDELLKMQKAGKVSSSLALSAVQTAVLETLHKSKVGEAGAQFADETLQGMENRFAGAKKTFLSDIADRSMPALKRLGPIIKDLSAAFSDTALIERFGRTFDFLGDLADRLGPGIGKDFATGLGLAADAFDRIVKVSGAFVEGFAAGFRPFLAELGGTGVSGVDNLTTSIQVFGTAAGTMLGRLLTHLNQMLATLDSIGQKVNAVRDFFKIDTMSEGSFVGNRFAEGIGVGLKTGALSFVMGPAAALAHSLKDVATQHLGIKSPSRVGMEIGRQFDRGVALGVGGGMSAQAGGQLGASLGNRASVAARQGSFSGSPVSRALTQNRTQNNFSITNAPQFSGLSMSEAAETAKATFWDAVSSAKLKYEFG